MFLLRIRLCSLNLLFLESKLLIFLSLLFFGQLCLPGTLKIKGGNRTGEGWINELVSHSGRAQWDEIWGLECVCAAIAGESWVSKFLSLDVVFVRLLSQQEHLIPGGAAGLSPVSQPGRDILRRMDFILFVTFLLAFSTMVVLFTELLDPATGLQHHHFRDCDYHWRNLDIQSTAKIKAYYSQSSWISD